MDSGPVSAPAKVAGREAVAINPADAAARGIADGDVVRVHNARGACLAGAVLTDAVAPGVVRLSCGAWYDPATPARRLCAHGNANVLTRDHGTSKLGQGPSSATVLVEIERFTGAGAAGCALSARRSERGAGATPMTKPELIDDLVAANRILADHGVLDAYGHISARDPAQQASATGSRAAWRRRWSRPRTSSSSTSTTIRSAPARTGCSSSA